VADTGKAEKTIAASSSPSINPGLQVAQSRPRELKTLPLRIRRPTEKVFVLKGNERSCRLSAPKATDPFIPKTLKQGSEA